MNQYFELETPDGVLRKGKTSAEGQVRMPLGKKAQYKLTIPAIEGDDRTEAAPRRGKTARKSARRIERGTPVKLPPDVDHVLELPERVAMTIAFLFEPGRDAEYPRFVLESEDGTYREEKTPRDDLVKGDAYLQLRFVGLLGGKSYRLTRWSDRQQEEVVFEGRPYESIVDSVRTDIEDRLREGRVLPQHGKQAAEE